MGPGTIQAQDLTKTDILNRKTNASTVLMLISVFLTLMVHNGILFREEKLQISSTKLFYVFS